MKNLLLSLFIIGFFSCNVETGEQKTKTAETAKIDIQSELEAIEETRKAFQLAIKENRFGDLRNYATQDVKSLTSDCGDWGAFKLLQRNPAGKFHYDSLVMRPKETIIVSDSVAYDFGTSSTYYTNEVGEHVELIATFLAVLKKDKYDGRWKLHREVANTRDLESEEMKR